MSQRYTQFYDLAQSREYPFDEFSTLEDDNNQRIPEGLLVDLQAVIDIEVAFRIFCSSITKAGNFCSVVFSAVNTERTPVGVATINLATDSTYLFPGQPVQRPISSLIRGFHGTVVFGEEWERIEDGAWVFSDPNQSLILARCCLPVPLFGEQSIGRYYSPPPFTGIVDLSAESDLDISIGTRTLGGVAREAIVISLKSSLSLDLLGQYAGLANGRPESRTCGDPQPVETINGVRADCCGRVFIELRGCAEPIPISNHCGVVLNCPLTLEDLCPPRPNYGETDNPDQCLEQGSDNPEFGV